MMLRALKKKVITSENNQHYLTMNMNPANSKHQLGTTLKCKTVQMYYDEDTIKLRADGNDASGNTVRGECTAKYDGNEYSITGMTNADTVALERPDARTFRFTFFFFQAEDGIRDYKVTGVQTCALPI